MERNRQRLEEYRDYVPKEFIQFYDSLTDEEKRNLTKFDVQVEGQKVCSLEANVLAKCQYSNDTGVRRRAVALGCLEDVSPL